MTKMKRLLCLSMALICLFTYLGAVSPRAYAYAAAKPLPKLTGNQGQDVANIAVSQLGYAETNKKTVYGAWWTEVRNTSYNYTDKDWCGIFAAWCAYHAGAGMNVGYDTGAALPAKIMEFHKKNGYTWTDFSKTPMPGDFIFFGTGGEWQHVAIVEAYNSSTKILTYVGGNQDDAVTRRTVEYSTAGRYGNARITGLARPKYTGGNIPSDPIPDPGCECTDTFAGYYTCTTINDPLNIRSAHNTSSSVIGAIPSGATVYVSKAQSTSGWAHVEYNDKKGFASMAYLRKADYRVEYSMDSQGKDVAKAAVTVFDHVTAKPLSVSLSHSLKLTSDAAKAPVVSVSAKASQSVLLRIPLQGSGWGVRVEAVNSDGTTALIEPGEITESGITVEVVGSITLRLVHAALTFPDVPEDFWARTSIDYLTSRDYMTGKLDGTFAPGETIQRKTVAMMLWRIAGSPGTDIANPFPDVQNDRYSQAILWAYEKGIISGYLDGTFGPDLAISRQHFIVMLHRYTQWAQLDLDVSDNGSLADFSDYSEINSRFREAAQWGLDCGLIYGRSNGCYDPAGDTSRAQMAVILTRFLRACAKA